MFCIKQHLPTLNQVIHYRELSNLVYFNLLKYINNSDDRGVAEYFDFILDNHVRETEKFNCLEKFLILLDLRSISIGDSIELKLKNNATAKLSLFSILENIKSGISNIDFNKSCNVDDIIVNLSIPSSFTINDKDDIHENVVYSVVFKSETYYIDQFTYRERVDFFKSLPVSVYTAINSYISDVLNQLKGINIITKNPLLEIEEVPLSIFDNTMFSLLKLLYKDDLMNFYEQQYSFIRKMGFSNDHFMQMTPNESKLFINLFNKDIKAQEESQNKNNNSHLGPLPAFTSM